MPYLNVRIAGRSDATVTQRVVAVLMEHTADILGKKSEVTSIALDFVDPAAWFIGGEAVAAGDATTFYLDIKITEGTNTKDQKARYVEAVFRDLEPVLGRVAPASYIVIDDVRADAWGFQGRTQESRFIECRGL